MLLWGSHHLHFLQIKLALQTSNVVIRALQSADAPRSAGPKTVTSLEIVQKVHKIILNDRQLKFDQIVEAVDISIERTYHILTDFRD